MLHDENRHHTKPKFRNHVRAHEQVSSNEFWYGDKAPDLGPGFTAAKTKKRATTVTRILLRASDSQTVLFAVFFHPIKLAFAHEHFLTKTEVPTDRRLLLTIFPQSIRFR